MISESTEKDMLMSCERKMAKQMESSGEISKRTRHIINIKEMRVVENKRFKADRDKSQVDVHLYMLLLTYVYSIRWSCSEI